jgi:hypothetical protein
MEPTGQVNRSEKISDGLGGLAPDSLELGGLFGSSLVALGDLDGDGAADLAVGAQRTTAGSTARGALHIVSLALAAGFRVSSWTPTDWGFTAQFSGTFDESVLNLYDTETAGLGIADATLVGATTGLVRGSLVVDPSNQRVTFIRTIDPRSADPATRMGMLDPDTYTLTLRSAVDGFSRSTGGLLDGDADGISGDDFSGTFVVSQVPSNAVVVGVPDFVRGPGQPVNLPADTLNGIPLSLSESAGVRDVSVQISYDPALLDITAATVATAMPAGATVTLDSSTPGLAIVTFSSPTDLPAGNNEVVYLQASVPADGSIYRRQQWIDVHDVSVLNGNQASLPVIEDDALHLATFFADVSGDGVVNASDAARVARIATLLDSGSAATPRTDRFLLADISRNGLINALDASKVAQFAALFVVPELPPIPTGIVIAGGAGPALRNAQTVLAPSSDGPRHLTTGGVAFDGGELDSHDGDGGEMIELIQHRPFEEEGQSTAIDRVAVDSLMSDLVDSAPDESGDEQLLVVLEDAIERLLAFSE